MVRTFMVCCGTFRQGGWYESFFRDSLLAQREEIALVILDLIMPGMGGSRCLEELLCMDPNVKVLVASGYSANGLSQEDKGSRERGFVSKPYDSKDILAAIRRVLDESNS